MKNQIISAIVTVITIVLISTNAMAQQQQHQMVRMAKIHVDPAQLTAYNKALKEQMTTAIKVEPGVLSYYAVADKANPAHITILEIYADTVAYKAHIETPHFKKYKALVQDMVESLELTDLNIVGIAKKPNM